MDLYYIIIPVCYLWGCVRKAEKERRIHLVKVVPLDSNSIPKENAMTNRNWLGQEVEGGNSVYQKSLRDIHRVQVHLSGRGYPLCYVHLLHS